VNVILWGNAASFQPLSLKHAIVIAGVGFACALVAMVGRRSSASLREKTEPALGVLLLLIWSIGAMADWASPRAGSATSLPLHWCDLTGILAGVVLMKPTRGTRAALQFWGITFSSIAFILPIEKRGPSYAEFWIYFGTHAVILMAVTYDLAVRKFTPTWRDFNTVALATAFWVVAVTPFNLLLGANYAYVGAIETHQRVIVSAFGEWPGRVGTMYLVSIGLMAMSLAIHKAARAWKGLPPVEAIRFAETRLQQMPA